jgi:CoA-transferase family III
MPFPRASSALSRFTVLDLTRIRSGPTAVRQFADWGANVVKIDALSDDARSEQPGGPRQGSDFQNLHRNKRAMIRASSMPAFPASARTALITSARASIRSPRAWAG